MPLPEFHRHPCFLRQGPSLASALCVLALLFTGCGDGEDIRVYNIPKESGASSSNELRPASNPSTATDFAWQLPGDWEEIPPAGMRVAHFTVPGGEGRQVEGYVVPLRGVTGQETSIVNLWRAELDLADLTAPQLEQEGMPIQIGDTRGRFYDFTSPGPKIDDRFKARILAAVTLHEGTTWCFKAIGPESVIADIKDRFLELLDTVDFHPPPGAMARAQAPQTGTSTSSPPRNSNLPSWEVPSDWESQTPGPMLLAQFSIPSETDASAEVTVSSFPGDVGGLLANVNRWRVQQLGLPPVTEAELDSLVTSLDVPGREAMLVDMTGTDSKTGRPARIVTAVHPHAGQTWFYKLMGDPGVVANQLDAFTRFVQSVRHDQ